MPKLFSFQGKISLGDRSADGKMLNPVWVGDAKLSIKLSTETQDHTESFSGQRMLYGQMNKSKKAESTLTLYEWLPENVALGLYAKELDIASSTVTGEEFPAGLVAGDKVKLDHAFVSSVLLTDSTGTPASLTLGTHYRVDSANAGVIEILNPTGFTQPFKGAYSYAAATQFAMFTETPPEKYLLLDGVNTETGELVLVELFRQKFQPLSQLDMITDDLGNMALNGVSLYDPINAADANLGGFGRILQKAA